MILSNRIRQNVLGILLLLLSFNVFALVAIPPSTQRVIDQTGSLSSSEITALEAKLAAFETQKGSQVAVLIVPTTEPEDIAQFGIRVAEAWKIGRKKVDDGVILIVAKHDRKLRIEVGYGLEGAIPDAIAKRVIAETITPYFKTGDFAGGIEAGTTQLTQLIAGEKLPEPEVQTLGQADDGTFIMLLMGGVFVGWILSAMVGRTMGGTLAAFGSGALGAMLLGAGFSLILGFLVFFIVGINQNRGRGWTNGGGGFGGGGFGGGGFGGGSSGSSWGGGGGGFGGGGADGSW